MAAPTRQEASHLLKEDGVANMVADPETGEESVHAAVHARKHTEQEEGGGSEARGGAEDDGDAKPEAWQRRGDGFIPVQSLAGYEWSWMCMPRTPCSPPSRPPPFFGNQDKIPWLMAAVMGLQHAIAMIASIVTVPLMISGPFNARLTQEEIQYLIAAGLIFSGIGSAVQVFKYRFGKTNYFLGTGLICVIGTSFTFVPICNASMAFLMREDSSHACSADADCALAWGGQTGSLVGVAVPGLTNLGQCNTESGRCRVSGQEAYGAFLGTAMLCSFFEMALSFTPRRYLSRLFPHTVTGVCVILIGVGLTGTGMKYWGGGVLCADNVHKRKLTWVGADVLGDATLRYPSTSPCAIRGMCEAGGALHGVCSYRPPKFLLGANKTLGDVTECETFADAPGVPPAAPAPGGSWVKCAGNGDVVLPYGSPQYVLLGLTVLLLLLLIEVFGSPFLRNCSLIVAVVVTFLIAASATHTERGPGGSDVYQSYVHQHKIEKAPAITFLWVHTFPLSIYPPAILPLLICFVVTTVETVGDITASCEASRLPTEGADFDGRIQGGLLADGVNSFLACICTSMPNTTMSQNNGVISLTRCANRRAGFMCCAWLFLFGVLCKLSAAVTSVPDCVLGGMVTFLFANIVVSGVRIVGQHPLGRRDRFVVAAGLGVGIGVAVSPAWATNALWVWEGDGSDNEVGRLFRDGVIIILSSPYSIGTLTALLLNAVIPVDTLDAEDEDDGNEGRDASEEGPKSV